MSEGGPGTCSDRFLLCTVSVLPHLPPETPGLGGGLEGLSVRPILIPWGWAWKDGPNTGPPSPHQALLSEGGGWRPGWTRPQWVEVGWCRAGLAHSVDGRFCFHISELGAPSGQWLTPKARLGEFWLNRLLCYRTKWRCTRPLTHTLSVTHRAPGKSLAILGIVCGQGGMQFLVPLDSRKGRGLPTSMLRALGKSGGGAPGDADRWDQLTWVLRWVAGARGTLSLPPPPTHAPSLPHLSTQLAQADIIF